VRNQFGSYEYRKGHEKSDMHLNIMKEGKPTEASTDGANDRKHQQWQPCDERDHEQAPMQEFQGISSKMRLSKDLEDGATEYQGEIDSLLQKRGVRLPVLRCVFFLCFCH
jgi:hypothetical protein